MACFLDTRMLRVPEETLCLLNNIATRTAEMSRKHGNTLIRTLR